MHETDENCFVARDVKTSNYKKNGLKLYLTISLNYMEIVIMPTIKL